MTKLFTSNFLSVCFSRLDTVNPYKKEEWPKDYLSMFPFVVVSFQGGLTNETYWSKGRCLAEMKLGQLLHHEPLA